MLKKMLEHKMRVAAVIGLVLLLVCVRAFEDTLFYDPLLDYYKTNFTAVPMPSVDLYVLAANLFLRYAVNTMISLAIIYAIFKSWDMVKFSALLYVVFFIILIASFVLMYGTDNKMQLFYIRRFIIQPLFLLLFVPAFYFQERASKKNNVS